jgi:hypothetical protein
MSRERERSGGSHRAADRADAPFDPDPKVFAGGLPFSLSPEEVRELFEQHGAIVEFHVSRLLFITFGLTDVLTDVIQHMFERMMKGPADCKDWLWTWPVGTVAGWQLQTGSSAVVFAECLGAISAPRRCHTKRWPL